MSSSTTPIALIRRPSRIWPVTSFLNKGDSPLKIDVHAHYVPESCLNDVVVKATDGRLHGIRIVQEGSRQVAYTGNARNIALEPEPLSSIQRMLKDMEAQSADTPIHSV